MSDSATSEFIFCEGCGARLSAQDRICPKCARPAPGILSEESAASDLAAGNTSSFPRVTSDMIAESVPMPSFSAVSTLDPFAPEPDAQSTSVLNGDEIAARARQSEPAAPRASVRPASLEHEDAAYGVDPYAKPKRIRARWAAVALVGAVLAGGTFFVVADPMGVMPGIYDSLDQAASDMFPSRQTPEDGDAVAAPDAEGQDAEGEDGKKKPEVSDGTLSEAEAFQRLSVIYGTIRGFQEELGPVIETYNGQYLAKDLAQREDASAGAFGLRDTIQKTLDEIDGLKLADDTAYAEDVDHMRQLATWMYNRVDVLCRSWDISLGLPEGERPIDHQDEILRPLREVEMIGGKAIDVVEYEENVAAWMPVEK